MPPGRPGDPHPWPFEEEGEGWAGEPGHLGEDWRADPGWRADHEAEFAAVAERQLARLQTRLPSIVARRVPVRSLTAGPAPGTVRMRLADGTTVLVTSGRPGNVVRVVRALEDRRAVTVTAWERNEEGLVLVLTGVHGREPARLRLLGPDQPD